MKLLGIIITYYPNNKDFIFNVNQFIKNVDTLIIWQNTPLEDSKKHQISDKLFDEKVLLMGKGKNMGIAYALNQAYEIMMNSSNNYTHLLSMDQDSTWVNFNNYCTIIKKNIQNAIYSPNINNQLQLGDDLINVKTCITSGAIFPQSVLQVIGKFNEEYSVDCVDYDFCFKALNNNIKIVKVKEAAMNQIYGKPMKSKFFNLENNKYASKRLFFIVRNHILLWRDYPEHMDYNFKRTILSSYIFGKILKIIFMEKNKTSKITSILNGLFAGLFNKRSKSY